MNKLCDDLWFIVFDYFSNYNELLVLRMVIYIFYNFILFYFIFFSHLKDKSNIKTLS